MSSSISTHSSDESQHEASAFLKKTYTILQDKSNNGAIAWSQNGTAFIVSNPEYFSKEILPKYFKHNNLKSFVRQLNIHGFKKCNSRLSRNREYCHEYFLEGNPELLNKIFRVSVKSMKTTSEDYNEISNNRLAELESENLELKNKLMILQKDLKPTEFPQLQGASDEDTWAVLQALQIYSKVRRFQSDSHLLEIDPTEEALFKKTKDLLETFQSNQLKGNKPILALPSIAQSSASFLNFENENNDETASLGKRSISDSQSIFQLDFPSNLDASESYIYDAEFDLGICN